VHRHSDAAVPSGTSVGLAIINEAVGINKPCDIWDIDEQQTSHSDVFDALLVCTISKD
jgi:hypothetical protein